MWLNLKLNAYNDMAAANTGAVSRKLALPSNILHGLSEAEGAESVWCETSARGLGCSSWLTWDEGTQIRRGREKKCMSLVICAIFFIDHDAFHIQYYLVITYIYHQIATNVTVK